MTKVRWVGPAGHYHPEFGDLVPGRVYEADEATCPDQPGFWERLDTIYEPEDLLAPSDDYNEETE